MGLGRIFQKCTTNFTNAPLPPRKTQWCLTPKEHQRFVNLATQGACLATQGHTVESLLLIAVNQSEANIVSTTGELAQKK